MIYEDNNDFGKIQFDEKIIGNIIRKTADGFQGRVMLSGSRGRIKKNTSKTRNSDDLTFMNIKKGSQGYVIDVYIVLKFGTSIKRTSHDLIDSIKEQVSIITEIPVAKVRIIITGMRSKNFSRRHIEVEG